MATTITNKADHLLIVPLNDGRSIYLAPGETSDALEEMLVSGNEKISKLVRERLVAEGPAPAPPSSPAKARSTPAPRRGSGAPAAAPKRGKGKRPSK